MELAKIRYALCGNYPKRGGEKLHLKMNSLIMSELQLFSSNELLYVYHSFRLLHKPKIEIKLINEILSRKDVKKDY